jgi:uncharacterized protein
MSGQLPSRLDLARDAERGLRVDGLLPCDAMERLSEAVSECCGPVGVVLQIGYDPFGRVVCSGEAEVVVKPVCQRCLDSFPLPLQARISLAWVKSEEDAQRLPESLDPLLSASGLIDLACLIEDELLLALPAVPRHAQCGAIGTEDGRTGRQRSESSAGHGEASGPFAALASLRRRQLSSVEDR